MSQGGISVDVQDQLLKERSRKRNSGTVPYPVKESRDLIVFDNWNIMFLTSLCQSLTLYKFETPPLRVLDLGCGGGLWIIEAAKQWPASTIVGFDILENQPNLGRPEFDLLDIAQRVSFVAGNVLDPLPFSREQFDFVRICGLGLGVPEDEWQSLLEECARVMKPGGCIEIVEDDLIFPCEPRPTTNDLSFLSPSSTLVSQTPATFSPFGGSTSALSTSSGQSSQSSGAPSVSASSAPSWPKESFRSEDSSREPLRDLEIKELLDPQDHSKLKMAWLEMLNQRFLNPRLLSVLPFYISSSFAEFQAFPTLNIFLPPNSQSEPQDEPVSPTNFIAYASHESAEVSDIFSDLQEQGFRLSSVSRMDTSFINQRPSKIVSSWASIHLARTVQLIRGCKEAIFEEYKKLEQSPEFLSLPGLRYDVNDEFEAAWTNWESDMQDRMSMRGKLEAALAWSEPRIDDEDPAWKAWRKRVRDVETDAESDSTVGLENVCRSLRGFVAWKPEKPDANTDSMENSPITYT